MAEPASDPFMKIAEGRFPLSENAGAARYWSTEDGVPRPDREYNWLLIMSIVFGLIGADHFYLRSPKTGLLKLLTFGGFGLWWIWDMAQLLTERQRVLSYGLTVPGDVVTGIGQGMITDKTTHYKSNSSYSMWTFSTLLGFLGLDSIYLKNMGQGFRKFVEGLLLILSIVGVGKIRTDGFHFSSIFAILGLVFFGIVSGFQWFITITQAFSAPENLFVEGIKFTDLESKQVNSTITWLIGNTSLSDERKAQVIRDLKYGDMKPEEVRAMFKVYHPAEGNPELPKRTDTTDGDPGSMPSFYILLGAPFLIAWDWIRTLFRNIMYAINPTAAITDAATKKLLKEGLSPEGLASTGASLLAGKLPVDPKSFLKDVTGIELPSISNAAAVGHQPQAGGARTEPLSLEGKVMAAATIALIGGGAVKFVIDNLVAE